MAAELVSISQYRILGNSFTSILTQIRAPGLPFRL